MNRGESLSPPARRGTIGGVAYDETLAARLRELLSGEPGLAERAMFGGVGFMLGGNMCAGAMKGTDLLVRVDPAREAAVLDEPHVRAMDMTGRPMQGWLLVAPAGFATDADLARWVGLARDYVRTLPPKRK